jgi:hypothetical protein
MAGVDFRLDRMWADAIDGSRKDLRHDASSRFLAGQKRD